MPTNLYDSVRAVLQEEAAKEHSYTQLRYVDHDTIEILAWFAERLVKEFRESF